jgi:hypothetical protein
MKREKINFSDVACTLKSIAAKLTFGPSAITLASSTLD